MFLDYFRREDPALEAAIAEGFADLKHRDYDTEDASNVVDQLTKLYALQPKRLSPDTVATIAANFGIAGMILWFEKSGVVTTKVPQFLVKVFR